MADKAYNYSESMDEIEAILAKIESGEIGIDELAAEVERAASLLQECKDKLFRTEQEVEKIMKRDE